MSEEVKKQFDEALKEGVVNCKSIVGVITGSAGVGKTCTYSLLLGRDPPKDEKRTSTGLEKPIRTVVAMVESEQGKSAKWSEVDMLHEIAIRAKATDTKQTSIAANDEAVSNEDNLDQVQQLDLDRVDIQLEHASSPDTLQTKEQSTLSAELKTLIDDITNKMEKLDPDQPLAKDITFLYLFDSGGQPHFHELLQSFIPKVSVNIFVVNLSEPLTHCPKVSWYQDGQSCGTPYDAPFSHEELLQHTIRAMQLKSDNLKILVAGTHRDIRVEDGETKGEKNEKLMKMLESFESNLIVSEGTKDLIYPLNAKQPDDHDKEVAAEMQKAITDKCTPIESDPIPLRWFMLLQMIQKLGEKTGMVSIADCQEIAKMLYINKESFDAAITYLADLNLLLYYPRVLKGVVFCDPHVILNKVTKLVWCSYLLNSKEENVPAKMKNTSLGDWKRFRDFGFFTKELLTHQDFKSLAVGIINDYGFDDKLFTPANFLTLLEPLHIAAALELSCKTTTLVQYPLSSTEKVYFLPCLRMRLESEEVEKKRQELLPSSSKSAAPLLICFPGNCPPSGQFCKLAVSLLSTPGWSIRRKGEIPTCLYRNCLEYYIEQKFAKGFVTLIDPLSSRFFEVYAKFEPRGATNKYKTMYPKTVGDLIEAINAFWTQLGRPEVAVTSGCNFFVQPKEVLNAPKVAFICTHEECKGSEQHPAFGHPYTETEELDCSTNDGISIKVTEEHKIWAEKESEHSTEQPSTARPSQTDAHTADPNYGNPQGQRSLFCTGKPNLSS